MWWGDYKPYVSAAQRRAKAARKLKQLTKRGRQVSPIERITGRQIATTFWGRAWCDNLEAYSDFSNRLPRGRTYVRNGSVIDLQIERGLVTALVSGSEIYEIRIDLAPLVKKTWQQIRTRCAGQIGSLVDLLQGKLSTDVMTQVTAPKEGLFPHPSEIEMTCSCPDYALLCKHLAAVLYGVGARLDARPELLFLLRGVDHLELISAAGEQPIAVKKSSRKKTIAAAELSDVFGIELESAPPPAKSKVARAAVRPPKKRAGSKAASANGRAAKKPRVAKPKPKKASPAGR